MRKILSLLLFSSLSWAQTDGARVLTGSAQPPLPFNILPQPGFENRTTGWSVTSGTFTTTQVTADVARGRFSAAWTVPASTSSGIILQSDPISVPPGLMGRQCVGIILSRGSAATNGTMTLEAYDGTTTYGSRAIVNAVTYTRTATTTFTCPTSGTLRLRIRTTATSPASPTQVLFDEAYLGENVSVGTGGGGAMDVTPTVSVTNSTTVAFTPSTRGIVYVQGNGAAVTADSTTPLTAGNTDGQELILIGRSNTNTVTIPNSGNVRLKEAVTLKQGCALYLEWDLNDTKWNENARSCSTGALDSAATTVADGATLTINKQARNLILVQGASGISTLNATTALTTGFAGQEVTLVGQSDVNAVVILGSTTNMEQNGNVVLGLGGSISYVWDSASSKWAEKSRVENAGTIRTAVIEQNLGAFSLRNFLKNPGAEINIAYGMTDSSAILTRSTTTPIEGSAQFAINATATSQSVDWAVNNLDQGLKNASCEARLVVSGDASLYTAKVVINAVDVATSALSNYSNPTIVSIPFSCGDLSNQPLLRISSTGDGAAILVDSIYLGRLTTLTGITQPSVQRLTSGSGTYNLPSPAPIYIEIEMVGGGSGGNGSTNVGGAGGNTTFSNWTAGGAAAPSGLQGGVGGANTAGTGTLLINIAGGGGGGGQNLASTSGAQGGVSPFGGTGEGGAPQTTGIAAKTNSGSGGGGCGAPPAGASCAGGGAGGYLKFRISSPASTYSYGVGAAGSAGPGTYPGGAGGSGFIIVKEYYQ